MGRDRRDARRGLVVRLEPLSETHLPGLEAVLDDPDVQRFTRIPVPPPPGFARTWLGRYEQGRREGTREAFALVDEDGVFLGAGFAVEIDRDGRAVELGSRRNASRRAAATCARAFSAR